jgi:hypothetical protein
MLHRFYADVKRLQTKQKPASRELVKILSSKQWQLFTWRLASYQCLLEFVGMALFESQIKYTMLSNGMRKPLVMTDEGASFAAAEIN